MAGRPTLLTPELIERAKGYLPTCIDVPYLDEKGNETGKVKCKLPSIEGLACFLDVSRESLYEWDRGTEELNIQFSDILGRVRREQASRILSNSMGGQYNSTIAKLVLHKHGYIDEKHQDITSGNKPIPILGDLPK